MESSSKSVSDGREDRLSGLPSDAHDRILSSLPIRDAARTSLLSTFWRYIWTMNTEIKFTHLFFGDMLDRNKDFMSFPKIVSDILLIHNGPILNFCIHLMPFLPHDLSLDLDRWLLFLSNNGMKTLELVSVCIAPYKLPSCIFLCKTLTCLKVLNCILEPPRAFIGFQNLVVLSLIELSFAADVSSNLLVNALQLLTLAFVECTGIDHLNIHAPKLVHFYVRASHEVDWRWFESNQQLKFVLILLTEVGSTHQVKTMNLEKLIGNLPKVCSLILDGYSLKFLVPCRVSAGLPTPALNMRTIRLLEFAVYDVDQISCFLCLLRSSPNLKNLEISVTSMKKIMVEEPVIRCLDASEYNDMKLKKLKGVKIKYMQGYKVELLLVKLLLACSTSLEMMLIVLGKEIDITQRYVFSKEVSRFCRASMTAEVIFSDPI